jgi:hypothetical protein
MIVNGLKLPPSFTEFVQEHGYSDWHLKEDIDAYGYPLEAHFVPLDHLETIAARTAELAQDFGPPDLSGYSPEIQAKVRAELDTVPPGFVPEITDFSKIVQFGTSPTGEPFCFDFRENSQEPGVICFPDRDARWRRIAPDFETFIRLFEGDSDDDGATRVAATMTVEASPGASPVGAIQGVDPKRWLDMSAPTRTDAEATAQTAATAASGTYPADIEALVAAGLINEARIVEAEGAQGFHGRWWKGLDNLDPGFHERRPALAEEWRALGMPHTIPDGYRGPRGPWWKEAERELVRRDPQFNERRQALAEELRGLGFTHAVPDDGGALHALWLREAKAGEE